MSLNRATLAAAALLALCAACAPTTPQVLPKETLATNMNAKLAPEARAGVEQDLEALFRDEKDIF